MYSFYLNIAAFFLTTLVYYLVLKPSLTLKIMQNPDSFKSYETSHYLYLAIYLLLTMIVQFIANAYIITSSCGGSVSTNLGSAAVFSFLPWTLIFGVVMMVLVIFPGFKSAFSDVVGYYFVSGPASKLLVNLLVDQDVERQMNNSNTTAKQKDAMQQAADTILKICGNSSILINQIVPSNFLQYWQILTPLMKDRYRKMYANDDSGAPAPAQAPAPIAIPVATPIAPSAPPESEVKRGGAFTSGNIKEQFFDLVVTRDNIGEAMWYIYTGILLISIVQLKISTAGCKSDPQTMQKNYQAYLQEQETTDAQNKKATGTVYTL